MILTIGVVVYFFGNYVATQVHEGETKIKNSQRTVDQVNCVSKLNKYSKTASQIATRPVQQKIDEGKIEVSQYKTLIPKLHIGGILLVVIGALIFIWGLFSKKKKQ